MMFDMVDAIDRFFFLLFVLSSRANGVDSDKLFRCKKDRPDLIGDVNMDFALDLLPPYWRMSW